MTTGWSRRLVIQSGMPLIIVGTSGCLKFSADESDNNLDSSGSPNSPTVGILDDSNPVGTVPDCPEPYKSLEPFWVVAGSGPIGGFELRLNRNRYSVGDILEANLVNRTSKSQPTGGKDRVDIIYKGEEGWHTIFGSIEGNPDWLAERILHKPGGVFNWKVTLTQEGLSEGNSLNGDYHACQQIKPGQYRFVYWGIIQEKEKTKNLKSITGLESHLL